MWLRFADPGLVGLEREREEREEHLTREGLEQCFSMMRSSPDNSDQTTDARVEKSFFTLTPSNYRGGDNVGKIHTETAH